MKNLLFTIIAFLFIYSSSIAQDFTIGFSSKTFRDADRGNRSINARIYYPIDPSNPSEIAEGPFPVVVLGHGFVMGSDAYQNFYDELVPRGYIVVFVNTEGSIFANHVAFSQDLAFMVDAIQAENDIASSVLYQAVEDKSALIGHSMGGGAAAVAASITDVETLVTFAPAILRFDTLTPASQVTTDAVVFSGSGDAVTPAEDNHIPIYNSLGSSCKYFINILGGAHCYYANSNFFCDFGERTSSGNIQITRSEQQEIVFNFLNSWFDYKLKDDLDAQQQFTDDLEFSDSITYENGCNGGLSVIPSVDEDSEILIFPNPASNYLTVQSAKQGTIHKIEIYNSFGTQVSSSFQHQVDIANLKPGHYLVKIFSNNDVVSKQVIIRQ